jgi:hypothetical protein
LVNPQTLCDGFPIAIEVYNGMNLLKIVLLLILGPSICPFSAYGQSIGTSSKRGFSEVSISKKVRSFEERSDSKETPGKGLNTYKIPRELSQSLLNDSKSLNQQNMGGVSDGGSTGIYAGHRLVLLDLYIVKPQLEQKNGNRLIVRDSKVIAKDQPAFNTAIQLLASSSLPYAIQAVIADSLSDLEVGVSRAELPVKRASVPDWLSSRVSSDRLKTIAMYSTERNAGAVISERYWNELGALSQAGVLVHEALRHIQFVDEDSKKFDRLSDEVLQNLTAQIILKNQPLSKSTDIGWFLNSAINNRYEKSQEIATKVCEKLRHQFHAVVISLLQACKSQLPKDEASRSEVLGDLALEVTRAIPDMLINGKGKEFMPIRDEALLLWLEYNQAIALKSKYDYIRRKAYEERSISDD